MAKFDKYGQIVWETEPGREAPQPAARVRTNAPVRETLRPAQATPTVAVSGKRDTFNKVTLTVSPILFGIIALITNQTVGWHISPILAFFIGALSGIVGTALNNYCFSPKAEGEFLDYIESFGTAAALLSLIGLAFR